MFLWLMCFLWLPILSNFFTGSSVGPTYEICVSVKRQVTDWRKSKDMGFCWCQRQNIGHNVKQPWICNFIFQETVYNNPSQHVLIMPAQCGWHYIGYPLSDLSVERVPLLPQFIYFQPQGVLWANGELSYPTASGELPAGLQGCSKVLSNVGELCVLMLAPCAVVNKALMEFLVQQWIVIKINSYLIID